MYRLNGYAQALAVEMGWDELECEALEFGAILHDIGKIYIPETVLRKPSELNPEEWVEMKKHPEVGARMIRDIPYLASAAPMILHHHEQWDGSGYPDGLRDSDIPEGARLLAVADSFDAMTSDRPYRKAMTADEAYQEIVSRSETQFDPQVVKALDRCWENGVIAQILQEIRVDQVH